MKGVILYKCDRGPKMSKLIRCNKCIGSGRSSSATCKACNGKGHSLVLNTCKACAGSGWSKIFFKCHKCGGRGKWVQRVPCLICNETGREDCFHCRGHGTVEVNLPITKNVLRSLHKACSDFDNGTNPYMVLSGEKVVKLLACASYVPGREYASVLYHHDRDCLFPYWIHIYRFEEDGFVVTEYGHSEDEAYQIHFS